VTWPWVSRKTLDAANAYSERVAARADRAERRAADSEQACTLMAVELQVVKAENKLLLDRILVMAGQPPVFHPAPAPPASPEVVPSTLPAPETRVGFDQVHQKARKAIATGTLNLGVTK
jgi:hypothetical protein